MLKLQEPDFIDTLLKLTPYYIHIDTPEHPQSAKYLDLCMQHYNIRKVGKNKIYTVHEKVDVETSRKVELIFGFSMHHIGDLYNEHIPKDAKGVLGEGAYGLVKKTRSYKKNGRS